MVFCMKVSTSFAANDSESLWTFPCPLLLCSDHFLLSCCSFGSSLHPHGCSSVIFLPHFPSVWKDQVWRIHMFHCGSSVYLGCWVDLMWVFTAHWSLGDIESSRGGYRGGGGLLLVREGSGWHAFVYLDSHYLYIQVKNIETFYLSIIGCHCRFC